MNNYWTALNLNLPAESAREKHRRAVFEATEWAPTPTTQVAYTAANRLLVVADADTARGIQARLPDKLLCYAAIPSPQSGAGESANAHRCARLKVGGYLGRFVATIDDGGDLAGVFGIQSGFFDQVLDCGDAPLLTATLAPPGYHYAGRDEGLRDAAIQAVPELIGEFEKPKYFHYDPDICAHARSGITGCTRCLDACAADAVTSLVEAARVEIVPHLCQGLGACAASCPTGAIRYTYPQAAEQLELLRVMLTAMRGHGGGLSVLIFDNEHGRAAVEAAATRWGGHILPLVVEEVGSVGLDLLACALAYGAGRVWVYAPATVAWQARAAVERNLAVLAAVCDATGADHRAEIIADLGAVAGGADDGGDDGDDDDAAATFAPVGDKRTVMRAAFGFFAEVAADPPSEAVLPAGAPFGQVKLNADACTLCMGCVAVCPAAALQAGGDTPALKFIEANCVQCGICAAACPEQAVTLEPRFHFDHRFVTTPRALKEEAPFRCIRCDKAFATQSMITRMTDKLKDHWMFEQPEALNRLKMCEDCRVKDLFERENAAR